MKKSNQYLLFFLCFIVSNTFSFICIGQNIIPPQSKAFKTTYIYRPEGITQEKYDKAVNTMIKSRESFSRDKRLDYLDLSYMPFYKSDSIYYSEKLRNSKLTLDSINKDVSSIKADFETQELIYENYKTQLKTLEDQRKAAPDAETKDKLKKDYDDLKKSAEYEKAVKIHTSGYDDYRKKSIEALRVKRTNALSSIEQYDSLYNKSLRTIYSLNIQQGNCKKVFPVREAYQATVFSDAVYNRNNLSVLNNVQLFGNGNRGSIYAELISGYMKSIKISFSTLIANTNDTIVQNEAYQRLISGGGNSIFTFSYPILYNTSQIEAIIIASPKFALDIPALGTELNQVNHNTNLGFDVFLAKSSDNKEFKFFTSQRAGYYIGTRDFYDKLNVDREAFYYQQGSFGVVLFENIAISVTIPLISSHHSLLHEPILFTTQIIPKVVRK